MMLFGYKCLYNNGQKTKLPYKLPKTPAMEATNSERVINPELFGLTAETLFVKIKNQYYYTLSKGKVAHIICLSDVTMRCERGKPVIILKIWKYPIYRFRMSRNVFSVVSDSGNLFSVVSDSQIWHLLPKTASQVFRTWLHKKRQWPFEESSRLETYLCLNLINGW